VGNAISRLVYHPPEPTYRRDDEDLALVWIRTRRDDLIPGHFVQCDRPVATILFSHGNAEDLGDAVDWARKLSKKLSVNVFCYDYTGYGITEGRPSERGTYADIAAVYDHLTNQEGIPAGQIILYGRSLGSGPTCELASRKADEIMGVILHSPLASVFRVALGFSLWGDRYENIDKVAKFSHRPVLIMHGTEDEVIPFRHAETIHSKIPGATTWWVDGGLHNNLETKWRATYYNYIKDFLASAASHPTNRAPPLRPSNRKYSSSEENGSDADDADDGEYGRGDSES
jgi:pimeloyl-ACP methyl ester carboxylesterase